MKKYLWIIGLTFVIAGAFGYAFSGASESHMAWVLSSVAELIGGVVLIVSYFNYHQLSGKRK